MLKYGFACITESIKSVEKKAKMRAIADPHGFQTPPPPPPPLKNH